MILAGSRGNVGIGTTMPIGNLNIYSTSGSARTVLRLDSINNESALQMSSYPGNGTHDWWISNFTNGGNQNWFRIYDYWNNTYPLQIENGAGNAALYLKAGGNVGVGTGSPQATLDVNGYARLKSYAAQPVACVAGNAGAIALTSNYTGCVCNGSAWVKLADSNPCAW